MRAAVVPEGSGSVVEVRSAPAPSPAAGEVLVEVRAAGLNHPDLLLMDGAYQVAAARPFVVGSEYAGIVREVGAGADPGWLGRLVMGATSTGALAEWLTAPAESLLAVPESVTAEQAAAFSVGFRTAYHALATVGRAQPGDRVLVLGAAGGVGSACVQVARVLGADPVAVAGGAARCEFCRQQGAMATIDRHEEDLRERLRALAPDGVDVVVDPVGGVLSEPALRSLAPRGRYVTLGFASGDIPSIPLNLVLLKDVEVRGFELRTLPHRDPAREREGRERLLEWWAGGRLAPAVERIYPLEEAGAAIDRLREGGVAGKLVVRVAGRA